MTTIQQHPTRQNQNGRRGTGHSNVGGEGFGNGRVFVDGNTPGGEHLCVLDVADDSAEVELANTEVELDGLLDLADRDRLTALQRLSASTTSRFLAHGKPRANLFEAVLDVAIASSQRDMAVIERAKLACLEAAVLVFPLALDVACGRIAKELRTAGVDGLRSDSLLRQAKEIAVAITQPSADATPALVREVLDDAPVDFDAVVPPGWAVSRGGLAFLGGKDSGISIAAPVVIAARGVDTRNHQEFLRLVWPRDGGWREHTLNRAAAADARKLVEFAGIGLPVTSNNAKALVEYLAAFEATNLDALPVERVTSRLRFQGDDGRDGFLWGRELLTAGDNQEALRIAFRGADEGDEQIADGLRSNGTLEGWLKTVKPLARYPRATIALYAALAVVLLRVVRSRNFIVDFAGQTTGGKTTCLRVAASIWGCPDESQEAAIIATWDSTRVFRERAPAVLNNLPFILDDTKRARHPNEVAQTIYDITQGRGRARGTVDGLARQETWSTIMLSSGEQPLISFSQDGGTRPRVLELWGSPFGATDAATGKVVRHITAGVQRNFGHAGPRFVRFALNRRAQWPKWRKRFQKLNQGYVERAGDHAFAGRMAEHLAVLHLASELAHKALQLPWGFADPIESLWDDVTREAGRADRAAAALQHAYSWACANEALFVGRAPVSSMHPPASGWAGVWRQTGQVDPRRKTTGKDWGTLAFYPQRLEQVLRDGGFEPDSTIRTWRDRGWLKTNKERAGADRSRYRIKLGRESPWMVAITREAIESLES